MKLNNNQQALLKVLIQRGAWLTAESAKDAWEKGERYYLDTRNPARKGLVRWFERCNKQAEGK
jgi:hypothetical protein